MSNVPTARSAVDVGRQLREAVLELRDRVDRAGVDVVVEGEVAAHPVADVHEVEELGEPALALRLDREDLVPRLLDELGSRRRTAARAARARTRAAARRA